MKFVPAKREGVHLLIGVAGGTGSGKTYSSLRMAAGMAGNQRFAVIDTEARRALHYADEFTFDHLDLTPPFTPDRYIDAIVAAEEAGYPVIVVDSMSHEHAGEGGLLEWHDNELSEMVERAKKKTKEPDWVLEERFKLRAWIAPKRSHKKMLNRLLQLRSHLILCFRADPKIKMVKDDKGKTQIVDDGWHPVCEKNVPYELTASVLVMHETPGTPTPLKVPKGLRAAFDPNVQMSEATGKAVAAWASGSNSGYDEQIANTSDKAALRQLYVTVSNDASLDEKTRSEFLEKIKTKAA